MDLNYLRNLISEEISALEEEAKSVQQQKLMGAALNCKKTGDCASEKVKKMANDMSMEDLKDFAGTKHDNLPEKVDDDKQNELKSYVKSEIHHILDETWSSTAPGGTRYGASTGIESVTPYGYDRPPTPPQRHRMHDKPFDVIPQGQRRSDVDYGSPGGEWKQSLLRNALVGARQCGANEQQAGKVVGMLKFVLDSYDNDEIPNQQHAKDLVNVVVNRFCSRND